MSGKPTQYWGFDYGTNNTALGIVMPDGSVRHDFVRLNPKAPTGEVLQIIDDMVSRNCPLDTSGISAWIEHSFFRASLKVFGNMVRTRTCIEIALDEREVSHDAMGDGKWKKMLYGSTKGKKEDIHEALEGLWPLEDMSVQQRGHVLDALSIAETARRLDLGIPAEDRRSLQQHLRHTAGR